MKTLLRAHGDPHQPAKEVHCRDLKCKRPHQVLRVMGTAGTARYSCKHQVHTVSWFAETPVGHCELDRHPDQIGQCPQGCLMTVEPVSGA